MAAIPASLVELRLHHSDALPAGTRLAEFELQGLLGVGGFGLVYRAYDHSLHRLVAIKEYMPSALAGRSGMDVFVRSSVDDEPFMAGLRSFMAEARLLAQFDHPSLVKVFRVWEQNHTAYIVMPLYQGMTLKQAGRQMRTPPPEAWLRKLLWSLLEALKVLHRHQMVHRDLSPDNIFLQDVGPPVLLDLGAARRAIGDHGERHTAILKVQYAPIEQYADVEGMPQGPWSDLYALAAVVHGCLASAPPVPATFRVLRDRLQPLSAVAESLHTRFGLAYSPAFVDAVTQALAVEPADRPQNIEAFAGLLQLAAPSSGMDRFDWRMELGGIWQPAHEAPVGAQAPVPTQAPAPRRTDAARPASLPAGQGVTARTGVAAAPPGRPVARRRRRTALQAVAAGMLCGVLLAAAIVLVPGSAPDVPAGAGSVTAEAEAQPAPTPSPEGVASAAPQAAGPAQRPTGRDVPRASARPPARALTAEDICPDSNFLTRPMCLHSACQTPRYAGTRVCVENARRLQDGGRHDGA